MGFLKPFILVLLVLGVMLFLIKLFMFSTFFNRKNDWKEDKENQILFANYDGGGEGITLELLNNQTFRVGEFSFLSLEYKEGKFEIKNDTIIFDRDLIGGTKAVLRNDTMSMDTALFTLKPNGKLNFANRFHVHSTTNRTNIKVPVLSKKEIQSK